MLSPFSTPQGFWGYIYIHWYYKLTAVYNLLSPTTLDSCVIGKPFHHPFQILSIVRLLFMTAHLTTSAPRSSSSLRQGEYLASPSLPAHKIDEEYTIVISKVKDVQWPEVAKDDILLVEQFKGLGEGLAGDFRSWRAWEGGR